MQNNEKDIPDLTQTLHDENGESARVIHRVVAIGCCVNILLMLLKLGAGYFGHSEALVADGFHSLNDILADIIMFVFVGISFKAESVNYSYGYGKFGTFSSLLMACMLLFISVMIAIEGIESIIGFAQGEVLDQPDIWTFVVVLFVMATKEGLYRFYSSSGRKIESRALIANAWHHRSDALASIATLVGVTFAHFFGPSFRVLDPVASLVIAVFIFIPAVRMLLPAFKELMDHSLPVVEVEKAREIISNVSGVQALNYLKTRRNGHNRVFDVGIDVKYDISVGHAAEIADNVKSALYDSFCPHAVVSVATFPAKT